MRFEQTILRHLIHNESYARKVLPFIKSEYFAETSERIVFEKINDFVIEYNQLPTAEAIGIIIEDSVKVGEETYKQLAKIVEDIKAPPDKASDNWLRDTTEKFCQDRAIFNAITASIKIMDGRDKERTKESLPEILKEALSVTFDRHIGHDYLEDWEERYDFYHTKEEKIPFDIDYLNKITRGGFSKKSLNILLAGTGVGKTLVMCHMAANNLIEGKNVLYITMEMAEKKIGERIDANLLNVMLDEIEDLPKDAYEKKIDRVRRKTIGKLIVHEFPTASAHCGHFRHLLNELALKKNFVPDIIYIDYLNICLSARIKMGANVNSYTYIKSIAEELRGLAVEKNVPVVSATQTTRSGFTNSDVGLEDTSESFGLPATADFMIAIISTDELEELNQYMFKQLKNRYNDLNKNKRFVVGVDKARMKLYDVEQSAQADILDGPVMDQSNFGSRSNEEDTMKWKTKKIGKRDFSSLKVS